MSLVGRRYDVNFVVARMFYIVASRLLGVEVEVEGEEHMDEKPAVLMANHQSELDILIIGRLMPKRAAIMAKQSLRWTPLGPFMSMSGALFIDRGNNARAVRSLEAAGEAMRTHKLSMWMFPEGTRHSAEIPDMLSLKKGGFHLAIKAGIPIIPIVTENYWRMYHRGVFDQGTIKVRVLPAISTEGLTPEDVPALTIRVRDQMLAALREISVKVPGQEEKEKTRDTKEAPKEIATPVASASLSVPSSAALSEGVSPSPLPEALLRDGSRKGSKDGSASENGTETSTEEDDGMVLVGRPSV